MTDESATAPLPSSDPEAAMLPIPYGEDAMAACLAVASRLTPDDLARRTPCAEFDVAALADHLVRSLILLAGIAGRDLTPPAGADLAATLTALAPAAIAAWRERGVDGEVAVGRTITPAPLAADIVALELVVHAWDLARACDVVIEVGDDTCEHLIAQAAGLITPDKRGRAFADAVTVAPDAPALTRLVAFTGRSV